MLKYKKEDTMKLGFKRIITVLLATILMATTATFSSTVFAEDEYVAPGTRQKIFVSPVDLDYPNDTTDYNDYNYYYMTEKDPLTGDDKQFLVYCFNRDLVWPSSNSDTTSGLDETGKYTKDYYVPDNFNYLPENTKNLIYRVLYAGYPHNNAGLITYRSGNFNPTIDDIKTTAEAFKTDEYLRNYIESHKSQIVSFINTHYGYSPDISDIDSLDFSADRLLFNGNSPSTLEAAFLSAIYAFLDPYLTSFDPVNLYDHSFKIKMLNDHPLQYLLAISMMLFEVNTTSELLSTYSEFVKEHTLTRSQAHVATQEAIWQVLYKENIPNNSIDFSDYMTKGSFLKALVDFAYSEAKIPPRNYNFTDMVNYKAAFENGSNLKRVSNDSSVGTNARNIIFSQDGSGKYTSEELYLDDMYQMPYELQLFDGEMLIGSAKSYGSEKLALSVDRKPANPILKLVSLSEWPSDVYQYANEHEKDMTPEDKKNNHVHQDMGGVFYKKLEMSLPLTATFVDAGKVQVEVHKIWDDSNNKDRIRPDKITVQLLANGVATGDELVLKQDNNWQGIFSNLYEKDISGNLITYSVVEKDTINGYTSSIDKNSNGVFLITNTHKIKTEDKSDQKPSLDDNKTYTYIAPNTSVK